MIECQYSVALVDDLDVLHVLGRHIGVIPAPNGTLVRVMIGRRSLVPRAVARPGCSLPYHIVRDGLQVVRPADMSEEIYERGGHVGAVVAQLAGLVVPRKHVVIIVPALAEGGEAHGQAVGGADGAATENYNNC